MLEGAWLRHLLQRVDVLRVGCCPPRIAFLTAHYGPTRHRHFRSHNSFEDNGIKFFSPSGEKLSDATEGKSRPSFSARRSTG